MIATFRNRLVWYIYIIIHLLKYFFMKKSVVFTITTIALLGCVTLFAQNKAKNVSMPVQNRAVTSAAALSPNTAQLSNANEQKPTSNSNKSEVTNQKKAENKTTAPAKKTDK
jgi:hypothetical protein